MGAMGGEKVELDTTTLVSRLVAVLERIEAKLSTPGPLIRKSSVTVKEAAALLDCSRKFIFDQIADGKLKRGPKRGKHTTVTLRSLEQVLNPNERVPRRPRSSDKFEPFTVDDLSSRRVVGVDQVEG